MAETNMNDESSVGMSNNVGTPESEPKQVMPRTTRVKPGRVNTDAIDPKYIKTVKDWVSYCERNNIQLGPDGSLQVYDATGVAKTIPFQKGFDAIRGVTMRSDVLRKKSTDFLADLRQLQQRDLQRLQDMFVAKEKDLLAATQMYRESPSHDDELAARVVAFNEELAQIHKDIQRTKYAFQEPVILEAYPRGVIQFGTHDESVIMVNQPVNMETTVSMRTLGLNGERLPVLESNDEDESNDETEGETETNESIVSSAENNNESESESNVASNTSSNESESNATNDMYVDELVNEIKTKLQSFTVPAGMTVGGLKSAIFTEERLGYYRSHIMDFNQKFREAYLQAITEEGTA
jgi:hypothetical protein